MHRPAVRSAFPFLLSFTVGLRLLRKLQRTRPSWETENTEHFPFSFGCLAGRKRNLCFMTEIAGRILSCFFDYESQAIGMSVEKVVTSYFHAVRIRALLAGRLHVVVVDSFSLHSVLCHAVSYYNTRYFEVFFLCRSFRPALGCAHRIYCTRDSYQYRCLYRATCLALFRCGYGSSQRTDYQFHIMVSCAQRILYSIIPRGGAHHVLSLTSEPGTLVRVEHYYRFVFFYVVLRIIYL